MKGTQTGAIIKHLSEILELLKSWKQAAQKVNNTDQIKKLDMLLDKYEDLYGFYSKIHGYEGLTQKYKLLSEQLSSQGCELKSDARKQWYGSYHSMVDECKKYVGETQGKHEEMHQKFKDLLTKFEAIEENKLKIDILYNYKVLEQKYNEFLSKIEKLDFSRLKEDFFVFRRELFDFGILLRYHPLEPEFDKNIRNAYLKVKKGTKRLNKLIVILNVAMEMKELDRLASEIILKMKEETLFESVQALVELNNKLGTLKAKVEKDRRYHKMSEFYASLYATIYEKMQKVIDYARQKYSTVVSNTKEPRAFNLVAFKETILNTGPAVDISNAPIAKIGVSIEIQPDVTDFGISTINFQPMIAIPKLPQAKMRTSVFSKVVVLGDSSVGKTHLILSMTENQYSPVQGSTIGVEKYYKGVKVPNTSFDTQICFWDLGGQFNYRTINELFIRDASAVILVFDITRPETFDSLSYWIDIIKHLKEPAFNNVILVANKVDVGGSAIPKEKISAFIAEHELNRRYIETSAKTGYNLKELLEMIVGLVDWSIPVQELDPNKLHSVSSILKALRNRVPIYEFDELIRQLNLYFPKADDLELKSMIRHYATQEALVISSKGTYILMEPEYIGKITAQCIETAAKNNGILNINAIQNWRYSRVDLLKVFNYFVEERKCFKVEENTYAFPIVLHSPIPKLPAELEAVLKSAPIVRKYEFKGPTISIASYILNSFAFEFGKPALINNLGAVWQTAAGKQKTVCLLQFKPSITGGLLTIEAGGGESETTIGKIEEKIQFFFKAIFRAPFSRI